MIPLVFDQPKYLNYYSGCLSKCRIVIQDSDFHSCIVFNSYYGNPQLIERDLMTILPKINDGFSVYSISDSLCDCSSYSYSFSVDEEEFYYYTPDLYEYRINIVSHDICKVQGFRLDSNNYTEVSVLNTEIRLGYKQPNLNDVLLIKICDIYRNILIENDDIRDYKAVVDSIRLVVDNPNFGIRNGYWADDIYNLTNYTVEKICRLYTDYTLTCSGLNDALVSGEIVNYIRNHWNE